MGIATEIPEESLTEKRAEEISDSRDEIKAEIGRGAN
jgi:hypothetical protein